jgi:hypothetical protein
MVFAPVCAFAQANPAQRPVRDITALAGGWNGSHLEQRQGCRSAPNNGFHGTYSEYGIYVDTVGHSIVINETGVTGLTCTWSGQYADDAGRTAISGSLSCSDGRAGTFSAEGFFVQATLMSLRLDIQLSGSETCAIDAILTGAHF